MQTIFIFSDLSPHWIDYKNETPPTSRGRSRRLYEKENLG